MISPEKTLGAYRLLADYLGQRLGRPASTLQRASYSEVQELLRSGQADLAHVCTYSYVQGQQEFGLRAVAVPKIHGMTKYHSVLVVPAGSHAESLLDLGGMSFASSDVMSNSGWLYPAVWLLRRGRDPEKFFSRHLITGSHDRSVLAVLHGQADGAAVDSVVYDQVRMSDEDVRAKVKVASTSPPFGNPPIVATGNVPAEDIVSVRAILLDMVSDPEGRVILSRLGFDSFEPVAEEMYESIREDAAIWAERK